MFSKGTHPSDSKIYSTRIAKTLKVEPQSPPTAGNYGRICVMAQLDTCRKSRNAIYSVALEFSSGKLKTR